MSTPAELVLQIATPFSTGTGFYLPSAGLVVTNEHVVRDNPTALVAGESLERCLMPVVYLDAHFDLAFLRPDCEMNFAGTLEIQTQLPLNNSRVVAMGQNYGRRFQQTEGEVRQATYQHHGIDYIQHTARLESIQSGGPLFDPAGNLLGINMYDIDEGHRLALSLPAHVLVACLEEFENGNGKTACRCFECQRINFEPVAGQLKHCRNCGAEIILPCDVPDHQPSGIQATVEHILASGGYDPRMARRGPNLWEVFRGSARIQIAYHEDSGLVTGDAHLCLIPSDHPTELFEYLLHQNYELDQLTFSTYGREIILSLLIYDRYLTPESGLPQFQHLFKKADEYDNYLVDTFGAKWE